MNPTRKPGGAPPVFALIFMSMFGFIGLTVVIFLWSADGFGEPPLIFKLFGTFIGIAFMAVGFGAPLKALLERNDGAAGFTGSEPGRGEPGGYKCPNCGAGLGKQEVSPSGDVKCAYCNKWWNIHTAGFTLIELLVIVAIVVLLAVVLIPTVNTPRTAATRVQCRNNMMHNSLGLIVWASDHADLLPWEVPVTNGGTMEFALAGQIVPQFQALSNYVSNPKLFACPADTTRTAVTQYSNLTRTNISYFVALSEATNAPWASIMLGDRNLQADNNAIGFGLVSVTTNQAMSWTRDLHHTGGSIGFRDGHVEFVPRRNIDSTFVRATADSPLRLLMP